MGRAAVGLQNLLLRLGHSRRAHWLAAAQRRSVAIGACVSAAGVRLLRLPAKNREREIEKSLSERKPRRIEIPIFTL